MQATVSFMGVGQPRWGLRTSTGSASASFVFSGQPRHGRLRLQWDRCKRPYTRPRIGFVLSGGGSRGAYEAGIIHYLRTDLKKRLGRHVPIDIVTGTSVGAINAAFIAATMDDLDSQAEQIVTAWRSLRIEELISLKAKDCVRAGRHAARRRSAAAAARQLPLRRHARHQRPRALRDPRDPVARHRAQLADAPAPRDLGVGDARRHRPHRRVPVERRAGAAASGAAIRSCAIAPRGSARATCSPLPRSRCCSPP